jgi:prepilin-type N-terminal cleavage/methylation domain-containing protein
MIGQATHQPQIKAPQVGKITASYLKPSQEGFTIIESLTALTVVSILLAAIAPVITLSVATRVQARRVELATQAARSYIDRLRTQPNISAPKSTGSDSLKAYAAPTTTGTLTCTANDYCTVPTGTSLYCVDFDGSGSCEATSSIDMIVQAFRHNATNNASTSSYALGVRVYRADAFKLSTTLSRNNADNNNKKVTQASFTGALGSRTAPLVEMTTEINNVVPSYDDLCGRLGGCTN